MFICNVFFILVFQEVMSEVYTGSGQDIPQLTVIVVNKRINSRVFANNGGKADNPPPGTVVDDIITMPERCELLILCVVYFKCCVHVCLFATSTNRFFLFFFFQL